MVGFPLFPAEVQGQLETYPKIELATDFVHENIVDRVSEFYSSLEKRPGDLNWREAVQLTEVAVQRRVNDSRKEVGIAPLRYVEVVADIARSHSKRMHDIGRLVHSNQLGPDQFVGTGLLCGENILYSPRQAAIAVNIPVATDLETKSVDSMAASIWLQWSTSPPHNENMLSPQYTLGGVGIYYDEETEQMYATHNLCFTK